MKKLKFKYTGKTKTFDCSTHAALFRDFFDWWKTADIEKTIFGTFHSGLRLSNEEYFEGQVIKKKNYKVTEDLYIITHITPAAMDKGIVGFLNAVGAEILEPKEYKNKQQKEEKPVDEEIKIEYDPEEIEEEIKQVASLISNEKNPQEASVESMADLVERSMKIREMKIKARLMRGNRSE